MSLSLQPALLLAVIFLLKGSLAFRVLQQNRFSLTLHPRFQIPPLQMSSLAEKFGGLVEFISGQSTVTEANVEATLKEVKTILLDADVNLQVANALLANVKEKAVGMKVESGRKPGEQFIALLAKELVEVMGQSQVPLTKRTDGRPSIILMSGLQGAGKTTAAAKLASWAMKQKYATKVLLVAADVYRPAAIDQLKTLGQRLSVDVYSEGIDANPVQICRKALAKAIAEGYDVVIVDTAGRQVVDKKLMDELRQIKAVLTPDETLLVVDAMTGQEAATLTARFNEDIGISGAILTKMDGDTRGGAALSIRGVSGKPIKFVGVGEGMDDLEPFYPDRMASRILGMGDVQSLIEKAQSAIDIDNAAKLGRKMQKGDFDFNDFLLQTQGLKKMGGMQSVMKMIPGMAGKITDEQMFELEKKMKRYESIIGAMSEEERSNPDLICKQGGKKELVLEANQRKEILAKKSGYSSKEIEGFVIEFLNMRKMMNKNMKGMDLDALEKDPNTPMQTLQAKKDEERKKRNLKPTRGGGGGFGSKS